MPGWAWVSLLSALGVLLGWLAFDHYWLKRPTELARAPATLSCSGCKQRDRRIRWLQAQRLLLIVAVASVAGLYLAKTSPH